MDDAAADGTDRETILRLLAEDRLESAPPHTHAKSKDAAMTKHVHTVPVRLLHARTWDLALTWLARETLQHIPGDEYLEDILRRALKLAADNSPNVRISIDAIVDRMFDTSQGHLAVAWQMLQAKPSLPGSLTRVMPPLARLVDENGDDEQKEILKVWWRAAAGHLTDQVDDIFSVANMAMTGFERDAGMTRMSAFAQAARAAAPARRQPPENHVVVMAGGPPDGKLPTPWKSLVGEYLPLVVAADVAGARAALHAEFPHATHVVDGLLRGVADGNPIRMTPTILLGPAGAGKSRLARRVAETLGLAISRYDAAGSLDSMFAGSPRTWGGSQPSVPARAILSARKANPVLLIDEIEKAGSGTYHGRLWDALVAFLDGETASRHPESGLDVELDLRWVGYIATANSTEPLPRPLKDRFRILKVPSPTLAHLPALAAQVMRDLLREEDRLHDDPLASDELEVIARAWQAEKFSMRKLQRLVAATLDVRDQMALRH